MDYSQDGRWRLFFELCVQLRRHLECPCPAGRSVFPAGRVVFLGAVSTGEPAEHQRDESRNPRIIVSPVGCWFRVLSVLPRFVIFHQAFQATHNSKNTSPSKRRRSPTARLATFNGFPRFSKTGRTHLPANEAKEPRILDRVNTNSFLRSCHKYVWNVNRRQMHRRSFLASFLALFAGILPKRRIPGKRLLATFEYPIGSITQTQHGFAIGGKFTLHPGSWMISPGCKFVRHDENGCPVFEVV